MSITGVSATVARLNALGKRAKAALAEANRESAEELAGVARVLIVSDEQRPRIVTEMAADGGAIVDFGPKAKVIEGRSGPRPFVNPALKATRSRRRARNRKALKSALALGSS